MFCDSCEVVLDGALRYTSKGVGVILAALLVAMYLLFDMMLPSMMNFDINH